MKLISFENQEEVFKRQQFHKFSSTLQLEYSDFDVDRLDPEEDFAIWLDYTDLGRQEFDLFTDTLSKIKSRSIVKITVPISRPWLPREGFGVAVPNNQQGLDKENRRIEGFKNELGDYVPTGLSRNDFIDGQVPRLILRMIRLASETALSQGQNFTFIPFFATTYDDGTKMLNVAGVVLDRSTDDVAKVESSFRGWEWGFSSWEESPILDIALPDLTAKERLTIEKHLPVVHGGDTLATVLGYTLEGLEEYSRLHLFSPLFGRIQL